MDGWGDGGYVGTKNEVGFSGIGNDSLGHVQYMEFDTILNIVKQVI